MEHKRPIAISELTEIVIGPGCFERVYEELYIKDAYKINLLIEEKLIVELKSKHPLPLVDFNQIHTHLSLTNLKHGQLINFKAPRMKEGIHRVFNNSGKEKL